MAMKRLLSAILCVLLLGSLITVGAAASTEPQPSTVPEWAVDDGADAQAAKGSLMAALPTRYDLRSEGLVTPVKFQNPWGSCWAFGGIAAAETSILSAYGRTYEETGLDLSERHLTYFALRPVTEQENPAQAGEGLYTFSEDRNAPFDAGGNSIYITTLFSQGVGPVYEEYFPYRGKNAITSLDDYYKDPMGVTRAAIEPAAASQNMTVDAYVASRAEEDGRTLEQEWDYYLELVRAYYAERLWYSVNDDWSIPALDENGESNRLLSTGVVLKNGNILPEYWFGKELNEDSLYAIKQELVNGRGVFISFFADQSNEYTMTSDEGGRLFNQYIDYPAGMDHGVCIVGWDDSYSRENFNPSHQPPADGAWIVKNSWGSTKDAVTDEDGNVWNNSKYGILEQGVNENGEPEAQYTGFFYLSYYDQTIKSPETLEFTANLANDYGFCAIQHDYMPANIGFFRTPPSENVTSAANVFYIDEPIAIQSVSTRTSEENVRVTFSIYEIGDEAESPVDGTMLYRTSRNFEYAGFHRLDLDRPIIMGTGKRISVVTTASVLNDAGKRVYSVSANHGASKAACEAYMAEHDVVVRVYAVAVVNRGESFLYSDDEWMDWKDCLALYKAANPDSVYEVDNFSNNVYAIPAEMVEAPVLPETGTFMGKMSVSITCATSGASIYYTTDGSDPTEDSVAYTEPFSVSDTVTVKAIAVKDGMADSAVSSATYTKSGCASGGGSSGGGGGGGGGSADAYCIGPLTVCDVDGNALAAIPRGPFLVTIPITRLAEGGNSMVFLAAYGADGQYRGLMYVNVRGIPVNAAVEVSLPVDNTDGKAAQLQAFSVESFSNLTPQGAASVFPAQ